MPPAAAPAPRWRLPGSEVLRGVRLTLRPHNARLLEDLELFVVATRAHRARLDLQPFGLHVAADACFDPLHRSATPLLDLLARLDALAFAPWGMPMPRWVFYDCSELPGGIVGFGARA